MLDARMPHHRRRRATAAGKALEDGTSRSPSSYDPVPDEIVRGFQQVVDLKPDVVGTSSVDATAYEGQMRRSARR
ncbi:MAG: hypothetical protein R2736_05410 [Solirubrobacterales bacterium]